MQMSVSDLAGLLGGVVVGDGAMMIGGAEVDSRLVGPGELFVALPGERRDGHEFVEAVLRTGGAALVRSDRRLPTPPPGTALIGVPDPLKAYHELARFERRRREWKVAAVTGSVGKTTTKDFLSCILRPLGTIAFTRANRNSTLGLPAQILSQAEGMSHLVAEAGMTRAGELDIIGSILRPDLLLYTRIAPVHLEFFSGMQGIIEAKAELLPYLSPDGTLVINADDPHQAGYPARTRARLVRYLPAGSQATPAESVDARLEDVEDLGLLGSRAMLVLGSERALFELGLPGRHQLENLLAAAAAAWAMGATPEQVATQTADLEAAEHRGRIHRLDRGIVVVDDSYNASPVAMARALELLDGAVRAGSEGRRVAVLGEMFELGEGTLEAHEQIGELCSSVCDVLLAVGGEPAAALARAAGSAGMSPSCVTHVDDAQAAAAFLEPRLGPGDVILIKGSRGVGLDQVVVALTGEAC